MPTTRRQSLPPTEVLSSPSGPTTTRRSTRRSLANDATRNVTRSPSVHLTPADEAMVHDAEAILGSSQATASGSGTGHDLRSSTRSAREMRHEKLNEAREHTVERELSAPHAGLDEHDGSDGRKGKAVAGRRVSARRSSARLESPATRRSARLSTGSIAAVPMERPKSPTPVGSQIPDDVEGGKSSTHGAASGSKDIEETPHAAEQIGAASQSTGLAGGSELEAELASASDGDSDEDSEDDSSDSGSDSDTSSSATSTSDDDDDSEEDSDDEEERLEKLLQAARLSAQQKAKGKDVDMTATLTEEGDDVLRLDADDEMERKEAPIPDVKVPTLPAPYLTFHPDGTAQASGSRPRKQPAETARSKETTTMEPDDLPYEKELSKREKARQPRKATVSEQWATLPAPRRDALPQMKRDYQALALSNSLDPKRFMKGGTKLTKVPELFAIGRMVDQPRHLQDTTLSREKRYQPGSIVQDLVRDEGTGSYAKRKFGDLQKSRMDNGRGRGWKKRTKW